jgi:hypothetical protein
VSTGNTGTRGSWPGDLPRRRVLLLAESAGLAAVLHHLLDPADRLSRLGTLRELAETRALENADVVILDVPTEDRAAAVGQVRRRYLGPLVVLVGKGDDTAGLHLDDAATLLTRPFSADSLGAALGPLGHPGGFRPAPRTPRSSAPAATRPSPEDATRRSPEDAARRSAPPAAVGPGAALAGAAPTSAATPADQATPPPADAAKVLADVKAAARQAPVRAVPAAPPGKLDLVDRVQRALVALTQGWKARRRVRVAGFSAFALVAFTVAFAMASQGRCGPGCDAFGTVFSPEPTIAASQSTAPSTTGPKRSTTTAAPRSGSPGAGAFEGISGGRLATTTTRQATTTTSRPVATTRPATTKPATTKSTTPPTTAPTTTAAPTTTQPPPTTAGA